MKILKKLTKSYSKQKKAYYEVSEMMISTVGEYILFIIKLVSPYTGQSLYSGIIGSIISENMRLIIL